MEDAPARVSNGNMDLRLDADERQELSELVEIGLTALSLVFVVLLVVEFAVALPPAPARWLELAGWFIWAVFTIDFVTRFFLAESKTRFLRANWLTALAVLLPAFRVFRAFRAVRAVRSLRLARLVTGTNRGARALRRIAGFAGAGYVVILTLLVWLLAAAGVSWLERGQPDASIGSFGEALWWSATTIIQQGSEQHPVTAEGRILAVLLMVFSLGVSGYITAALAAFLLGRRRQEADAELTALRDELRALRRHLPADATDSQDRSPPSQTDRS